MGYSKRFGASNESISGQMKGAVAGVRCGVHCGQLKLKSYRLKGDEDAFRESGPWTPWFSEESLTNGICPDGWLVSQVHCQGRSCDKMRLDSNCYSQNIELIRHLSPPLHCFLRKRS